MARTLNNAIAKNKIAHAYLFSGPRGTGKTTTAKLIAKALNCTNMADGKICDECENCRLIKEGMHPDVIEIDAASNNGVDEVRDLIEKVKYAPIEGKKKVYIIDEIHMMSQGAFNALLKTLEDPPDHVVFILATTEIHKVLDTIKSRCQKFVFKKISEHDIVACMQYILKNEEVTYEDEALYKIASLSDGGMRDALSLLEQVMIYNENKITLKGVYEALSLVAEDKITQLYELVMARQLNEALVYINSLSTSSIDFKQVISELLNICVDNLVKNKANQDNTDSMFLLNLIENLDESLNKLKYDNSKKLYLELAIIKSINKANHKAKRVNEIINQASVASPKEAVLEVKPPAKVEISSNNSTPPVMQPKVDLKPITKETYVTFDELMNVLVNADRQELEKVKKDWQNIANYLFNINTKKYAGLLSEGLPVAASTEAIIMVSDDNNAINLINDSDNIGKISRFVEDFSQNKKYCFAISRADWDIMKDRYIQLRKESQLPAGRAVLPSYVEKIFKEEKVDELEETDLLVFGKKVFKDTLIIKKEDEINEY